MKMKKINERFRKENKWVWVWVCPERSGQEGGGRGTSRGGKKRIAIAGRPRLTFSIQPLTLRANIVISHTSMHRNGSGYKEKLTPFQSLKIIKKIK